MYASTFLFLAVANAATVYLHPSDSLPSRLSSQQANLVLSTHLGLEQFEVVDQSSRLNHLFRERDFVGQGDQSALLLLVDEAYARDILPPTLAPSFSFSEPSPETLPILLTTWTQRASHAYTHVTSASAPLSGFPRTLDLFSGPEPANEAFLAEAAALVEYVDALPATDRFAALELTGLSLLATEYGTASEQVRVAAETVRASVDAALQQSVRLAVVTYAPGAQRRERLVAASTMSSGCFDSVYACGEATNECSGHGQCMNATSAGQACFVCACTTTVSETGKVQNWVGDKCERRDVSGPFVLITGTVITLILLMGGSVSLLYAVSSQELPSILTGGVAGGVRKD